MKITIEPTGFLTELNGQPVRLWEGITDTGTACHVYVALIGARANLPTPELDRELAALPAPPEATIPLWMLSPGRQEGKP